MDVRWSDSVAELAVDLAKAQAEVKGAKKDSENPHFRSKYADLASIWDACREALTSHGFSIVQSPDSRDGEVGMNTILLHKSGQWIHGRGAARPVKADPQGVGSCISYLRRYCLAAMIGVVSEDDDGEAAVGRTEQRNGTQQPPAKKPAPRPARPPRPQGPTYGSMTSATPDAILDAKKHLDAIAPGRAAEIKAERFGDVPVAELDAEARAWLLAALVHEEVVVRQKGAA